MQGCRQYSCDRDKTTVAFKSVTRNESFFHKMGWASLWDGMLATADLINSRVDVHGGVKGGIKPGDVYRAPSLSLN